MYTWLWRWNTSSKFLTYHPIYMDVHYSTFGITAKNFFKSKLIQTLISSANINFLVFFVFQKQMSCCQRLLLMYEIELSFEFAARALCWKEILVLQVGSRWGCVHLLMNADSFCTWKIYPRQEEDLATVSTLFLDTRVHQKRKEYILLGLMVGAIKTMEHVPS